jgi:hypothetical protein
MRDNRRGVVENDLAFTTATRALGLKLVVNLSDPSIPTTS